MNPKRMPPIQMLTRQPPQLDDVVALGPPCTVFDDPGKTPCRSGARHVSKVETLDAVANQRLQRAPEDGQRPSLTRWRVTRNDIITATRNSHPRRRR
ncbi:TPA: hypothetical protein N0F65_005592 [Lagenidium giganteum]|uniref:Uncharacterized protein n=1 Tax=Lagenidium giganteum TaxID=4803 RepID=A0AAV2Z855_9STRA|nr:TPA: hypothetical protein N0F65_005592 [Lagenidium giganteum]